MEGELVTAINAHLTCPELVWTKDLVIFIRIKRMEKEKSRSDERATLFF